jgi:tRNA A-37 threonylcarbamoyl transferase component Bud32
MSLNALPGLNARTAQGTQWALSPGYESLISRLQTLPAWFGETGQIIYQARNQIRHMLVDQHDLVVKSFALPRGLNRFIYGRLRQTKARKSYVNAHALIRLGISTPAPVGFIEFFDRGSLKQSYYLSVFSLAEQTVRPALTNPYFPNRQQVLLALGQFTFGLHQKGVHHRDYSPGNILLMARANEYDFSLVDVNRMRFVQLNQADRMRNFSMLWASDADLSMIIQGYAQASGEPLDQLLPQALAYSRRHKSRMQTKERLKQWLLPAEDQQG